jgi:glycogen(starch) synthase
VAVVTPWYPTTQVPFGGSFVRSMVEATAPACDRLTVYHVDGWGARISHTEDGEIWRAHQALVRDGLHEAGTVGGARLRYVPVPVRVGTSFAGSAQRHAETLRLALGSDPIEASVVHAHVGLRGGWTALQNARPDARVFVTEHASFLNTVLDQRDSRAMYDEVISRCTGFFAVGEAIRNRLVTAFPHHADRIQLVPNPVSFALPRRSPVTELRRWLFVGTLAELKGVHLLLEAFIRCRDEDSSLTLTFVGHGRLLGQLEQRVRALGLTEAVTFIDSVPPDQALRLMREHDLLVHPSRLETFGMTIVEAIAAGMPVLVTRCGGPEKTLAGIEDAAGELIDVTEDADAIVSGFRRLRARFPHGVDPQRAATVLASRYSYEAVARAHHLAWFPTVGGPEAGAVDRAGVVEVME